MIINLPVIGNLQNFQQKNFVTRMWNFSMLKDSYVEIENELFQF